MTISTIRGIVIISPTDGSGVTTLWANDRWKQELLAKMEILSGDRYALRLVDDGKRFEIKTDRGRIFFHIKGDEWQAAPFNRLFQAVGAKRAILNPLQAFDLAGVPRPDHFKDMASQTPKLKAFEWSVIAT